MIVRDKFYIDGAWVAPAGTETLEVFDSTTEDVFATIPAGTAADIDRAVQAAARAFPAWSATAREGPRRVPPEDRRRPRRRASSELARHDHPRGRHAADLSEMLQVGLPIGEFAGNAHRAGDVRVGGGGRQLARAQASRSASSARSRRGTTRCTRSRTRWPRRSPRAARSCVEAERGRPDQRVHPRRDHRRGRAPEGRVQPRDRPRAGRRRGDRRAPARRHGLVHRLDPRGQARHGALRRSRVKRVSLELGGKSANIILEDADLARPIPAGVFACYLNSGQTCSALDADARPPLEARRGRGARRGDRRGASRPATRSRSRHGPRTARLRGPAGPRAHATSRRASTRARRS